VLGLLGPDNAVVEFRLGPDAHGASWSLNTTGNPSGTYLAEVRAPGLCCSVEVAIGLDRFQAYFAGLAGSGLPWDGELTFTAWRPEVDYGAPALVVRATVDKLGHVLFAVQVGEREDGWNRIWHADCEIRADLGQLDSIASQALALTIDCASHR